MTTTPRLPNPQVRAALPELARLATLSAALLLIDDAHRYGLIDSGPEVNRRKCRHVIARAALEGIAVDQDEVAAAALELMAELGVVRP